MLYTWSLHLFSVSMIFLMFYAGKFWKMALVQTATARETVPAKRMTAYSAPLLISNRKPYNALPSGCAHMDTVRIMAITFPIRCCGVSAWTKESTCTVKIVEKTMMIKQHTAITV